MNRRGGFMFVSYRGGVNIKYNNQPDDDAWRRENGQQEQTMTSQQRRRRGKFNGVEVGCLNVVNRRGGFVFVFYQVGGQYLIQQSAWWRCMTTSTDDEKEQRQQRRQVKENSGEVGRLLRWIGEGDSCLFFIEGVNVKFNNQPDDDAWRQEWTTRTNNNKNERRQVGNNVNKEKKTAVR
jgi:hypothetical protein